MILQFEITNYQDLGDQAENFHQVVTMGFKEDQDWHRHIELNRTFLEVAIFDLKKTFESLYPSCDVVFSTIFKSDGVYANMGHTANHLGECVDCERKGLIPGGGR